MQGKGPCNERSVKKDRLRYAMTPNEKTLNIAQINLNGQIIAPEQLRDICIKDSTDLVLCQEPPTHGGVAITGFEMCAQVAHPDNPGAAIIVTSDRVHCICVAQFTSKYVATAKVSLDSKEESSIVVVSAYFNYSKPTTDFTSIIRGIAAINAKLVICADCNGHSKRWHCPTKDQTGRIINEMIDDLGLVTINLPSALPTFMRTNMGSSNIDITLVTTNLATRITDWCISDNTDSDHVTIGFCISLEKGSTRCVQRSEKYNTNKANWQKFITEMILNKHRLESTSGMHTLDTHAESLVSVRRDGDREYRALRNNHVKLIRSAKMKLWGDFGTSINVNTWGRAFSWAKSCKRANDISTIRKNTPTSSTVDTIKTLLNALLPGDDEGSDLAPIPDEHRRIMPTSCAKVRASIWRLKPNKAPGHDGITGCMLRRAWPALADELISLFGRCLQSCTFPKTWKEAKLVVIPKAGKKDKMATGAYRPISILPTLGKALETLIIDRLETETRLDSIGEQHGYVRERSTMTAIKAMYNWVDRCPNRHIFGVFLNITGAFDHVRWTPLLDKARPSEVILVSHKIP